MITLDKQPLVLKALGISKSTLYNRINSGLMTPPVSIGPRSVAWPSNEIESIVHAQIADKTENEIYLLVKVLIKQRKQEVA